MQSTRTLAPAGARLALANKNIELLDAAAACFMLSGFDATSIDTVASKVGATKGRIYHHFRTKLELFFAVYERAMALCFDAVKPARDADCDSVERLSRMIFEHALVMMNHLPYQRVSRQGVDMHLLGSTTPEERRILSQLVRMRDAYEELFRAVLREGMDEGVFAISDVSLSARFILDGVNGITYWYKPRAGEVAADRHKIAQKLVDACMMGIVRRR